MSVREKRWIPDQVGDDKCRSGRSSEIGVGSWGKEWIPDQVGDDNAFCHCSENGMAGKRRGWHGQSFCHSRENGNPVRGVYL